MRSVRCNDWPADLLINDGMSTGRHYTVQEIGKMWKLSETMVRDLFREEPGVLRAERPRTRFKRGKTRHNPTATESYSICKLLISNINNW
jgi:hypothetical protein